MHEFRPPPHDDSETMTSDSGKDKTKLIAERGRKARRQRLQIQRLRSVKLRNHFKNPGSDQHSTTSSAESSGSGGKEENIGCGGEGPSERKGDGLDYGHVSVMGRRRVMEDSVTVAPPVRFEGEYSFFAVYDGHGGAKVAEICSQKLHTCLDKHIEKAKTLAVDQGIDWQKVMADCFCSMDEEFGQDRSLDEEGTTTAVRMMGSTAVVVLVGKEEVVVANCGDSRAVLCRGGVALPLSSDHKPDRLDEKQRIEAAGGNIINWNGWRVQGVLATSRSLGDYSLKPYVISEPEVTVINRTESDHFLIIATDGLWDVVGNKDACQVVKNCLSGRIMRHSSGVNDASEAAAILAELAIAKGSKDNISVIVVHLK